MNLSKFTKKIHDLPTISIVASQINVEEKKESLTAKSLSVIIAKDPALTSKVLKLANSAYYGLVKQVNTLDRAVTVLGFNTIKSLALTVAVFNFFKHDFDTRLDIKGLWFHSLGCAVSSKVLVSVTDAEYAEQAFVAGIIHDIGIIAIAHYLPHEMEEILKAMHDLQALQFEVEKEILGFTHQRVGGLIADQWNFPEEYIQAIKYHDGPIPSSIDEDPVSAKLARAVYIGNQLAKVMRLGKSIDPSVAKIPIDVWQALGISREVIPTLRESIKEDYKKMCEAWDIEGLGA